MLCDNCKKNEATVQFTEIINGNKREMMLCEECSRKLGVNNINFKLPIDFSSFFGDLISDYEENSFLPVFDSENGLRCKNCNTTYKEFLDTGMLGCSDCYDAFQDRIDYVLKRIQGSSDYQGRKCNQFLEDSKNVEKKKVDKENKKENKKEKLEEDLKKAIKEERYEDAAKIRDEIKKLEQKKGE